MNQRNPGRRALRVAWASPAGRLRRLCRRGPRTRRARSARLLLELGLHRARARRRRAARAARVHQRRPPRAVARLSVGAAMWAIGELIYEIAYSEAPELAPYPSIADAFWLGSYFAVGIGIVLVLRSRLRRAFHATMWLDAAIGATTIAALAATIAFDPVLTDTAGYGWEIATDLAYPLARPRSARARRHAARADRLAARARLGAVRGRALDAGDLRRPLRARDRARHRLGRHAARAGVAGGDAAAGLRRVAAAEHDAAPRPPARARVHLPGRLHAARARDPRLRPDPLGQHARRRARRDRDRARRRADGAVVPRQPAHAASRAPRRADRRADRAAEPARVHRGARPRARGRRGRAAAARALRPRRLQALQRRLRTPGRRRAAARACRARSATWSTATAAPSGSAATSSACCSTTVPRDDAAASTPRARSRRAATASTSPPPTASSALPADADTARRRSTSPTAACTRPRRRGRAPPGCRRAPCCSRCSRSASPTCASTPAT